MYRAMVLSSGETSLGALLRHPHGLLLRDNRERDFLGKRTRVLRPGAKVDVAPPRIVSTMAALDATLEEEIRGSRRLKLISKRERTSHNSWMHNVEAFVRRPRDTNYLYMHPSDAAALGLRDGDLADVSNKTGSVRVPVKCSADMMPGAVALPHGWGHASADGLAIASATRGVNANALANDGPKSVERLSGMAHLTGIPVEVRPVPPAAE
jgi:anaerobic selenocysteine-containing dehydrogenase